MEENKRLDISELVDKDGIMKEEHVDYLKELVRSKGWKILQAYGEYFTQERLKESAQVTANLLQSSVSMAKLTHLKAHMEGRSQGVKEMIEFPSFIFEMFEARKPIKEAHLSREEVAQRSLSDNED